MKHYNKRGQEGGAVGSTTVATIITVAVVFLVAIALIFVFPYIKNYVSLWPSPNETISQQTGLEQIRYDAQQDTLQYYTSDGKWATFPSSLNLDEKNMNYNDMHSAFVKLFDYSSLENKKIPFSAQSQSYILLQDPYLDNRYTNRPADMQAALFTNTGSNPFIGQYVLSINNNWIFYPDAAKTGLSKFWGGIRVIFGASPTFALNVDLRYLDLEIQRNENALKTQITDLRDSATKKTITFTYGIDKTTSKRTINVCAYKMYNIYFVADLTREVKSESEC